MVGFRASGASLKENSNLELSYYRKNCDVPLVDHPYNFGSCKTSVILSIGYSLYGYLMMP